MRIGYAKLGRSMPLDLRRCGSLGGDVEMVPTLKLLAERYPEHEFILIGRNSGEDPRDVGLPANVSNPWIRWAPDVRARLTAAGLTYPNLSIDDHRRVADVLESVTGPTFDELDGVIMWLGQHGTSNQPLPMVGDRDRLTKPYDWATLYGSYLLRGINRWRDPDPLNREEVLLNADPRNYVKYRDGRWPWRHSILSQYNYTNKVKHERSGLGQKYFHNFFDALEISNVTRSSQSLSENLGWQEHGELWTARAHSVYARLEISALMPGTPFADLVTFSDDWNRPHNFGMVVNETRREVNVTRARRTVLRDWVLPLGDRIGFIHGKWSEASLRELGVSIHPVSVTEYFARIQSTRCTFTTPASGSGWATAKPWESFAAGVICFFHPDYDDQDNILGDADLELRSFLRVRTPGELRERIDKMSQSEPLWRHYVHMQHEHLQRAIIEEKHIQMIERRLAL